VPAEKLDKKGKKKGAQCLMDSWTQLDVHRSLDGRSEGVKREAS